MSSQSYLRATVLTRCDLVHAISPSRSGSDKSKWNPDELSRPKAEAVVNVIFGSIAEALRKGEKVTLPIGTFEVLDHTRPPLRGWFLGRVRVTYRKQRRYIKFTPAEGLIEPEAGPG
jgi:nucleoid DNA-binding protein